MASPIENLKPSSLWKEFDALRKVPRPSKKEERAREHVRSRFAGKGYEIKEDKTGNMVVRVPATSGLEGGKPLILQSHLDMVTEKNSDVTFDWDNDPIDVWVDGDWVKARGTTLGADNGIGVAAAIASALDPEVEHGPLELLFTVDEETGLTGAMGLDPALLAGKRLLNLDSEEDGVLYVGCAGGSNSTTSLRMERVAPAAGSKGAIVKVTGLAGGHSGCDIHENRGNAIKLLVRFLTVAAGGAREPGGPASPAMAFELAEISGGNKHNAIPREAQAVVAIPAGQLDGFVALAGPEGKRALSEFATSDPGLRLTVEEAPAPKQVYAKNDRERLLALLAAIPTGVIAMSREIRGLVETSNNLASIRSEDGRIEIVTSTRSSVAAALRATLDGIAAVGRLAGAEVVEQDGYPGWQPNMDSELLKIFKATFKQLYARDPHVAAIHAGLETALIGKKVPGIDMISYGPEIKGPHSPDERVQISSVARFWDFHKAALKALAKA